MLIANAWEYDYDGHRRTLSVTFHDNLSSISDLYKALPDEGYLDVYEGEMNESSRLVSYNHDARVAFDVNKMYSPSGDLLEGEYVEVSSHKMYENLPGVTATALVLYVTRDIFEKY